MGDEFKENAHNSGKPLSAPKKETSRRTGTSPAMNVKTAAWGGLPGKSGPNRSAGVKKVQTYPKSEGL